MSVDLKNDPQKIYFIVEDEEDGRDIFEVGWVSNAEIIKVPQRFNKTFKMTREKLSDGKTIRGFLNGDIFTQDERGDVTVNVKEMYRDFNKSTEEILEYANVHYLIHASFGMKEIRIENIEQRDRDASITVSWEKERDVIVINRDFDVFYKLLVENCYQPIQEKIIVGGYECNVLRDHC